tara:strand:- start:312 stop:698 length:387 start_codon:yes stop_codon:yes gene_type:complete
MNFLDLEKALIQPTMEVVAELSIYRKRHKYYKSGCVYTLYKKNTRELRIGFLRRSNELESLTKNSDWIIVGSRYGSSREERLIRETLEELGCFTKYPSNNYDCSTRLIKHLTTLGWPIDKFLEFRSIG